MFKRVLAVVFSGLLFFALLIAPAQACDACAAYGSDLSDSVGDGSISGADAMGMMDDWIAGMHP